MFRETWGPCLVLASPSPMTGRPLELPHLVDASISHECGNEEKTGDTGELVTVFTVGCCVGWISPTPRRLRISLLRSRVQVVMGQENWGDKEAAERVANIQVQAHSLGHWFA